jgi:mono/diheme cytochrome c family protein
MIVAAVVLALAAQNPDELKPGLVAEVRSLIDPTAVVTRIDPKPAYALDGFSLHPRIPPGPFEVVWTGFLLVQEKDAITFGGDATIEIDGRVVTGPIELRPGFRPIKITSRAKRVQLTWEAGSFSREPIPPWKFLHVPIDLPEVRGRDRVGKLGCARCHRDAFPGVQDPPPGPSLADLGKRVNAAWLMSKLDHAGPMTDAEKKTIAATLLHGGTPRTPDPAGDHRMGRRHFVSVGCAACHFIPDEAPEDQPVSDRLPLAGLNDKMGHAQLAAFLADPKSRYPDGRMPAIPLPAKEARDIAAFVLLWSKPAMADVPIDAAPNEALVREKRCAQCHEQAEPIDIPIKTGGDCRGPRFTLDDRARKEIAAYVAVASRDRHRSDIDVRRRKLERAGCMRCHTRDFQRPSPLEEVGSTLGGAWLQMVPFLKTPRLTNAWSKYSREYLLDSIRNGVTGVRHSKYTYRMPAFGAEAETLAQALLDADGDDPTPEPPPPGDPTLPPLGPALVGFGGYSCVSCHIWQGKSFAEPDPGAIGPELTTVTRRIRREWFDRWVEDPSRVQPGTPMPQIFKHGLPATLGQILDGNARKQKDAVWAYLSLGKDAPAPKPLPLLPLEVPTDGPLVAQVPVVLPDKKIVEGILVLFASNDLLVYDVSTLSVRAVYVGARVVRQVKGRIRQYLVSGMPVNFGPLDPPPGTFVGYDRLSDGVRIRSTTGSQEYRLSGRKLGPIDLLPPQAPPPAEVVVLQDPGKFDGALERPGYRATPLPRPKSASGEDLIMPGAIAAEGDRVFVASMKRGEIYVVKDGAFQDYTGGLFQEAYSMVAERDALYVLHRRNLTKVVDTDGDGKADRFDRVVGLPHGVADTYDYGYGLNRDKTGAFVMTYAPYANHTMSGSGSLIRLLEGGKVEEIAYGFRNPLGWVAGPEGDLYYTDNQGEWVATNKLCHIVPGRYYGFPNSQQKQHAQKPFGKTSVWVPYAWAHSINGVTFDTTGGKFGPFAGQFFMAELMFGGAIIRASVETVNGEVQGSCFPFWGKGLLGPVVLTFDPKGRLWVGSITEPGWMAQPDRGALYRLDFTGETPFEIREIRARRDGFRLIFTAPVDPKTAADPASYLGEHYRYEYTGAYGSPELDRTRVTVEKVAVAADGLSADLTLPPLVKERVYLITAKGVKSAKGGSLVHPQGAYTLNEIPR